MFRCPIYVVLCIQLGPHIHSTMQSKLTYLMDNPVLPFDCLLPGSTHLTNGITAATPVSRPHLSKPANRRRLHDCPRAERQSHTGNSEKNRKEREKKLQGLLWSSCEGTNFHPSYQLNQYLWIARAQVLQQVESLTANSSVAPLEIISPSLSLFTSIEFPALLFALPITWKKVNPRVIFILIFALIVVFTLVVPDGFAQ